MLGFGCGSVLGRVGRSASLRAMNVAWDQGITLFDTARSYGFGEAEAVLGEFLRGKRDQAIVTTKFGLLPQKQNALKRMAVPVARAALQLPGIRSLLHRGGSRETTYGQFTVEGLRASLDASLLQLRTDHIDVLFLHEASSNAIRQQDLMSELDALVQAGKVRRVGLYAEASVVSEGMTKGPATLSSMQFGANPFDPVVSGFTKDNPRGMFLIGNHPFGSVERMQRAKTTLHAISVDEAVPATTREKLGTCSWQVLLEAIFGVILNGSGVHTLVLSMMQEDHLRTNVKAIEENRFTDEELAWMRERLLASPATDATG